MALCAFYAVWGLLLEAAVAFGPVPRITWEHRGKKRNFSVIWDIATTSGFLWDLKLIEAVCSSSLLAASLFRCCWLCAAYEVFRTRILKSDPGTGLTDFRSDWVNCLKAVLKT